MDKDGKIIYHDPANQWMGYKRQDKLALGYVDGTKGYLGNNVWSDANYDGVQQADEEGVGQGRGNGGVKVKLETWYYAPAETHLAYVQKKDADGNPLWKTNAAGVAVMDPESGQKVPVMEWTLVDSGDFSWQLYPGDDLREAVRYFREEPRAPTCSATCPPTWLTRATPAPWRTTTRPSAWPATACASIRTT